MRRAADARTSALRLTGRRDPIDAARRHVYDRAALRAQDTEILTELFSVGRAVLLARRDVAFPIEHDQVAVVRSGDRVSPPGDQFAGARGCGAVERHFRNKSVTERLQFGEGECPQGRIGHLGGIGLAACGRVRRELLAKQVRPFSRFGGVRGELFGRQFLHELVQNDAAHATPFDCHWGVELSLSETQSD
jgi:hypothetical protein